MLKITNLNPGQVSIYRDIVKYLPFVITNKRVRGWQHIKNFDWGYIEMRAWETITVSDILVLIAAVKAFQDHEDGIWEGVLVDESVEVRPKRTLAIKVPLNLFQKKYVHRHDEKDLVQVLKRLVSYMLYWHSNDGSVTTQRYILDFEIDRQRSLTIVISKQFYELCQAKGWVLALDKLQSLRSPVSRALAMYLSCNSSKKFKQQTLVRALGLAGEAKENRRKLKEAFGELEFGGHIESFQISRAGKNVYFFAYEASP